MENHNSNQPHEIITKALNPKIIEAVGPQFLRESMLKAQHQTRTITLEVLSQIREGMTEDEARLMALSVFSDYGVKKHWHRPFIRFGEGTALTFHDPIQPDYKLQENDPFYIDLGPVWKDESLGVEYEGDYGDTFVLGENKEASKCAKTARELFQKARQKWLTDNATGEQIYAFLKTEAESRGYILHDRVDGHRVSDFPHQKYSKERLAALTFKPADAIWVLEVQILDSQKRFGAFFEDLL